MSEDLYQYSRDQLALRKGDWPDIAKACEVSYSWLCKFADGKIEDPSYRKIVRLADLLRARAKTKAKLASRSAPPHQEQENA